MHTHFSQNHNGIDNHAIMYANTMIYQFIHVTCLNLKVIMQVYKSTPVCLTPPGGVWYVWLRYIITHLFLTTDALMHC